MHLHVIVPILACIFANSRASDDEDVPYAKDTLADMYGKMIHASVLFRHGDRSIERPYPTDPNPVSVWTDGLGQLSKRGKLQEYDLGMWLRSRYKDPLNLNEYHHDLVMANSSNIDRTLMSAELVLASLFPPSVREMWTKNITWQPIPVHTKPTAEDLIAWDAKCDRYDLEIEILNNLPEFQAVYLENEELFDYVATHAGYKISPTNVWKAVHDLCSLYDDLFIESLYNLTIPLWTKKVFPEQLKEIADFSFSIVAYTHEMRRLKGGPLLAHFIDDMRAKRSGKFNQRLHLYSGHDSTISTVLSTLNIFNHIAPLYSSAVLIELREKNDDFVVTISYKNSTYASPYILQVPGCPDICTLDKFIEVTKDLIPSDWQAECKVNVFENIARTHMTEFILVSSFSILSVILMIALRMYVQRRRRYIHYECVVNEVLKPSLE